MDQDQERFENLFERVQRDVDPAKLKRAFRFGTIMLTLLVLAVIGFSALVPSTEYLWFLHDARHPDVFDRMYETRGMLSSSFAVGVAVLFWNLKRALASTMVFLDTPSSRGQVMVTHALSFFQTKGLGIVRLVAPILAFFSALDFSNEWSTYLLASHSQTFGLKDPTFGLDIGFFVFHLPWYRALANFTCALLLLTTVASIGIYAGLQAMAALAKIELGRPQIRRHIHILIGLTILAYAAQLFLKSFEAGMVDSGQFTGAGLAAMQGILIQRAVAVFGAGVALGTILNGWKGKPYLVPTRGGVLIAVAYVLGVLAYPSAVQRFWVDPNRLAREAPYAANAIQMTRYAYGLDKIELRNEAPTPEPTAAAVTQSQTTLDNMRLWDPQVLQECLEGFQGIRQYYRFYDVDVDRYMVGGKPTLLMLAPRELDFSGLTAASQNWTSERLFYTHGYGVDVARVDEATPDGEPALLDEDIPQKSDPSLKVDQPRIYFGYEHDQDRAPIDEYALVDTGQPEFDYPTSNANVSSRWDGDRGIPIGGLLTRLAYAIVLGDGNLLVSPNIRSSSRLLMHRDIIERARRIYPFLTFDGRPYIVLANGRVVWMMDGYTSTDMVPYSAMSVKGSQQLNYIRNSVKVTIDADTGETTAYAVDEQDPLLKAWQAIYPGLVKPRSEVPQVIEAHFRYPEDLLNIQSNVLCLYHVTEPSVFLGNNDIWNIASERNVQGEKATIRPFYVELKLPDEPSGEFVQILPFTPNSRINMSGWLAAHCDPGKYGRLTLYELDQARPIGGPEQMEGEFNTTPEISNINKQFQNAQSSILVGNLLVLPIGDSFLYCEPLFLKSNTQDLQSVPRLAKVVLAFSDKIKVENSYRETLTALLGSASAAPSAPAVANNTQPAAPNKAVNVQDVKNALGILDQADAALRQGDFAKYGALIKDVRERLRQLTSR